MNELSTETLNKAATDLHAKISENQGRIRELAERLDRDQRELALIVELLRLRGHAADGMKDLKAQARQATSTLVVRNGKSVLIEAVNSILGDAGRPLHIQELTAALRKRGVAIPGKGSIANVISVIRTRPEISRPQRGIYALTEWGSTSPTPPIARRAPRRRRK
jgi:hypothetical protein